MAWYNTYRPKSFDDVIGQDLAKKILQNAIAKGSVRHAYLLAGSKGVGKTTLARIFANSLNNTTEHPESSIDIIEMDAASNTGIDDIRNIIDSAKIPPLSGKYKIFIIDEVHMLSKPAMNALLKILEEPPAYLVFLLATTNPEKLLPTIHSRLTLLKLHNHSAAQIIARLQFIAEKEGMKIDRPSLEMIAKKSDGSQRDAINLLETVASYDLGEYTSSDAAQILGLLEIELLKQIHTQLVALVKGEAPDWANILEELTKNGTDPDTLLVQLTDYALETSFHGDSSLNGVIPHLIDLQSKRYPLNSNISLLAILHALIVPVDPSTFATTQKTSPSPSTQGQGNSRQNPSHQQSQPKETAHQTTHSTTSNNARNESDFIPLIEGEKNVEITEIIEDFVPVSNQEILVDTYSGQISQPNVENKNTTEQAVSQAISSFTKIDAAKSLANLLASKTCQPMLKIMAGDMEVDKVEGEVVTLSVTNGIFESQLKNKAMTDYITKHLQGQLNTPVRLDVVSRTKSSTGGASLSSLANESSPDSMVFSDATEPTAIIHDYPVENNIVHEDEFVQEKSKSIQAGEIFYSVYKKLPAEMTPGKLPIYDQEIPDPDKPANKDQSAAQIQHHEDDWDKHSEEMFEFE